MTAALRFDPAQRLIESGRKTYRSLNGLAVLPNRIVYAQPAVKSICFTHGVLLEIGHDDNDTVLFNPHILTQI